MKHTRRPSLFPRPIRRPYLDRLIQRQKDREMLILFVAATLAMLAPSGVLLALLYLC